MQIRKRGDEIKKKSSLKLLSQSQPNFAEMILGWSPFKIVSVSAVLYPRWPPLLRIEIYSNGQNCSILSQKVPKFELYKHNDELFSSPMIKAKLYMNVHWTVLYNLKVFCSDMKFKMAATAGLSLTLDPMGKMFQNASSLKPLGQLKPNCPGMIIGRSSTKFLFFMPIGNPRWPPPQDID